MADRRVSTTLKNLALALLNATLILIAVCLFLAWQVLQSVETISDQLTDKLLELAPLRADVQTVAAEGAALRAELQAMRVRDPGATSGVSPDTLARLATLEARLTETADKIDGAVAAPETLVIAAMDHALDLATGGLTMLAGCKDHNT